MGMQTEFNWYIVTSEKDAKSEWEKREYLNYEEEVANHRMLRVEKEGYRVYPMDTPLPLIYNGKCLAMFTIEHLTMNKGKTELTCRKVLDFAEDDPARLFYEQAFAEYKEQQEHINDGGITDLRHLVNPSQRMRVSHT